MALTSVKLDQIPNLEHLSLECGQVPNDPDFSNLSGLLDVSSPMTKLVSLNLRVQYGDVLRDEDEVLPMIQSHVWRKLDDILSRANFPSLRRVAIIFRIYGHSLFDDPSTYMSEKQIQITMAATLAPYFAALAASPTIAFTLEAICDIETLGD